MERTQLNTLLGGFPSAEPISINLWPMVAELEPQVELGKAIFKDEDGVLAGVRTVVKVPKMAKGVLKTFKNEVADLVNDIKGIGNTGQPPGHPRPSEAGHPAIESVDYRTWGSVKAGLERDRVHATHLDQYLRLRGVPAGRWPAIDAACQARVDADPLLAEWADFRLRRIRMTGAVWSCPWATNGALVPTIGRRGGTTPPEMCGPSGSSPISPG